MARDGAVLFSAAGRAGLALRRRRAFLGPGARQDAGQGVVALVAGVFVELALQRRELVFAAPGLVPDRRRLDGEAVEHAVLAHAGEALGDLQVLPGPEIGLGLREVVGLDDQGVALIAADRVAEPGADVVGAVAGVQPDVAHVV